MERRSSRLLCIAVLGGLLAASGASAAEPVLPLGTDGQGVHLRPGHGRPVHGHRRLVLTFDDTAAARYRRIAGRWFLVSCVRFDRNPGPFDLGAGGASFQRVPHRRRPIPVLYNRRYDICTVRVHARRTTFVARIPLTARGAARLDERNTAVIVVAAVRLLAKPERPSAATVAARLHGVALTSSAELPPPGTLGVFSDGAEHVYAAQTDRSGDLLFVDLEGDVTRSNVLDYLLGEDPLG